MIVSTDALHYFPKEQFWPLDYPYHSMLLDKIKTANNSMQMG
jgi:hypothetical protein